MTDFPDHFVFGSATASYQIEGGHDADGKGRSTWDAYCEQPGRIADNTSGRVACDHYHRFKDDVALMQDLNLQAYRFSISWPRVMPGGGTTVNEAGLAFYDRLVDELCAAGITPFATMFHWDTPLELEQQFGGWRSKETARRFGDYAAVIVDRLGDRVKNWMTVNEIDNFTRRAYVAGVTAPGLKEPAAVGHQCVHNALYAHGLGVAAVRACRHTGVQVGVVEDPVVTWPIWDAPEHREAALAAFRNDPMNLARLYPMMEGRYRDACLAHWGANAPDYSEDELQLIGAATDFVGINCYGGIPVMAAADEPLGYRLLDQRTIDIGVSKLSVAPLGLATVLQYIHQEFSAPPLYITENGWGERDEACNHAGDVFDVQRKEVLRSSLGVCRDAIAQGIDLRGYFVWSFMDNFEWISGNRMRFGLVRTDYTSQQRQPKLSAQYYRSCITKRSVL